MSEDVQLRLSLLMKMKGFLFWWRFDWTPPSLVLETEAGEKASKEEAVVENTTPDYAAGLVSTQVNAIKSCSEIIQSKLLPSPFDLHTPDACLSVSIWKVFFELFAKYSDREHKKWPFYFLTSFLIFSENCIANKLANTY